MDLDLEPPTSLALMEDVASELRQMASELRDRNFSNDDCAEVLEGWVDRLLAAIGSGGKDESHV